MATKLSDALKVALKALPEKEKDKLLLRLVPKTQLLVDQLEFSLVEEGLSIFERKAQLIEMIEQYGSQYPRRFHSPGYLMMDMRDISGRISYHVSVTKDKLGEIELNLLMLNVLMECNLVALNHFDFNRAFNFNEYVVKRALKIINLVSSMDEDYLMDFSSSLVRLGELIAQQPHMMKAAIMNMLDVNYLLFPERIFEI